MLQKLRLWVQIMIAMGAAIAIVGNVLTFSNMFRMNDLIREAERSALDAHFKTIKKSIKSAGDTAEVMSALVASIPLVQERFAAGDRKAVGDLFIPGFKTLSRDYGIEQFQFHTPPAMSWLRMHLPEKFGDDLSSFRHTVVTANKTVKPLSGLEGGVGGLGVRGMTPVLFGGRHVGSVEFGLSFGQHFFDSLKEQNGVDAALHVFDGQESFKTLGSTFGKETLLPTDVLRKALGGQPQIGYRDIMGAPNVVYAAAIADYSGKSIGVVEVAMDNTRYREMIASTRMTAVAVAILSILGGLALAMMLARHFERRIGVVVAGMERIAQGDFSQKVELDGKDEIASLARAAEAMREGLHGMAKQVGEGAVHLSGEVHAAAQEISAAVEGQAATSSEMSSTVAEITSTMEELLASSAQIAEHSKAVASLANQAFDDSRKGSEAMQQVLDRIHDIRTDNQLSLEEIVELGAKSKRISKVMEIINAVADQTKLIAFNAALEASSAGEAGKRFSVVAGEIRRLADSVTDSTSEIETKIVEIQDSISRLVITSEKGAAGISAGLSASANTAERLKEIVNAASQTTSAAQQISLSTHQQKTASNQVVVALREIVSASSSTAHSITRISQVSKDMLGRSARLEELVKQFKLGASEGDKA